MGETRGRSVVRGADSKRVAWQHKPTESPTNGEATPTHLLDVAGTGAGGCRCDGAFVVSESPLAVEWRVVVPSG